jgi:hypothetical protein
MSKTHPADTASWNQLTPKKQRWSLDGAAEGTAGYSREPNGWQEECYSDRGGSNFLYSGGVNDVKKELAAGLSLVATVTLFFSDILFAGLNLYLRDIQRFYYAYRAVLAQILRSGELPFWNRFASGGQPLAANPAHEVFYPAQWLVAFGDLRTMVHLEVILHYPIAALGFYLLSRSLGCRRWVSWLAAFAFALGGLMLSFGSLFPFLFSAAWLPWIAYFFRQRRLALAAISLGLLLLAADVSMILQAGALLMAYGLYKRRGAAAALVIAVSILIGAAQIVPALDLQRDSGRGNDLSLTRASTWTMPASRPLELIWPTLFASASSEAYFFWGAERLYPRQQTPLFLSLYPGLMVTILVIAGFIRRLRGAAFAAAVALLSYLAATGPLFMLMYRLGFRSLRYPEKFFVTAIFAFAIFAAMAAEEAARDATFRRTCAIVAAVIAGVTAVLTALTGLPAFDGIFATFWRLPAIDSDLSARFQAGMLTSLAIAAVITLIFATERISPRLRVAIVMLIVIVDVGIRVDRVMPRITADYYTPPPATLALAKEPQPVRIYSHADWQRRTEPQPPLPFGIRSWILRNGLLPYGENIWGFEGLADFDPDKTKLVPTIEYDNLLDRVRRSRPDRMPLVLAMGGATHVSTVIPMDPQVIADPRRFDQIAPVVFSRLRNAGRFYFARQLVAARNVEDVAQKILSNEPLPIDIAFTADAFSPAPGRVIRAQESANRVALDVEAAGRGFLVLAITPHRYWAATIDGKPAALVRANVGFQGLVVDGGRHHIELRYRNPVVIASAWISLLAFIATAGAALRRKAQPPPSPH